LKPISKPIFIAAWRRIGVTILPPAPAPKGRVSGKLSGSACICMGAMSLRKGHESGSAPFTCRDFVNTNEHFIHQ
jgi:hypothetical protein